MKSIKQLEENAAKRKKDREIKAEEDKKPEPINKKMSRASVMSIVLAMGLQQRLENKRCEKTT